MPKWVRVKSEAPYIKSGDFIDPEEDSSLVRRLYSEEGKKYPILCITIHPDIHYTLDKAPLSGIKISVSSKPKKGSWWDEYMVTIPLELFSDLEEMLAEVKAKVK